MTIYSGNGNSFDNNLIYSNYFSADWGPDKIQCGPSTTVFGNMLVGTFNRNAGGDSPGRIPDRVECAGNYIKIHDNTFSNVLDSGIDWDTWSITSPHDQWIYNNVFENSVTRNTTDDYPEYIRVYSSGGNQTSFTNFKIWNNTFADDPDWDAVSFSVKGSPTR